MPLTELLQGGGFFFVDSSHTLGPAGEVTQLICDVLPTLPAGSWVHFHDIMFPFDYSPEILTSELFFCHETALLHAFLLQNERYSIAASLSMLHHESPDELAKTFLTIVLLGSIKGFAFQQAIIRVLSIYEYIDSVFCQ